MQNRRGGEKKIGIALLFITIFVSNQVITIETSITNTYVSYNFSPG